jgi:C1A family cysteine protease
MSKKKLEITPEMKKGARAAARAEAERIMSKSEQKRRNALRHGESVVDAEVTVTKGRPTQRALGWVPEKPDHRDRLFSLPFGAPRAPKQYDMTPMMPPVYDQGTLGSCTANAALAAVHFTEKEKTLTLRPALSRLFTYYFTRMLEGSLQRGDVGATIRGTFKSLNKYGYCLERLWKYDINVFNATPPSMAREQAARHKLAVTVNYESVPKSLDMIKAVVALNNPVVFGFSVPESFMSAAVRKSGVVPMPAPREKIVGGHAVTIVGYNDETQMFIIRNSWGKGWGQAGYCLMPYAFVMKLGSDFWTVKSVPAVEVEVAA